jgi:hypothetical protein
MVFVTRILPSRIVSGSLGNPQFSLEYIVPGCRVGVTVQIDRGQAEQMVWWHLVRRRGEVQADDPEIRAMFASDDQFLDELGKAAREWIATCPAIAAR